MDLKNCKITFCFDCVVDHGTWKSWGIMYILDMQKDLRVHAGPDHWNDPDMMEVGNGMTVNDDRAHFTMWCMLAAPLIAGNDLRNMSPESVAILTNREVIAVDQDSLGIQGFKYSADDSLEIWFKPLYRDSWAVCFLNRDGIAKKVTFDWKAHPITDPFSKRDLNVQQNTHTIRDLWAKKNIGKTSQAFIGDVGAHDLILLKLSPVK